MKTNLKFIMIALFTVALTSCSPEDGKDGVDGMDGEQGIPGQDGNANVKTFLFENIPLEIGESDPFAIPAINQDILDYGVVLGYISDMDNIWFPLPYSFQGNETSIFYMYEGALITTSNFALAAIDYRFVVIEGNPGTGGKNSEGRTSKQAIYAELKTAGVDINNYDAVVNYYTTKNAD